MRDESASTEFDESMLELCSNRAAWQVAPKELTSLELEVMASRIIEDGYTRILRNHLCHTFEGSASLTLFPSGKLMIKCEDRKSAIDIARRHLSVWLSEE